MKNLRYLIKTLGSDVIRSDIRGNGRTIITELMHLPDPEERFDEQTAVVGSPEDIKRVFECRTDLDNITFFSGGNEDLMIPQGLKCNLVVTTLDNISICRKLDAVMRQYMLWDIRLLQSILNSDSPSSLLAECVAIAGTPFYLLNSKFEVVSSAGEELCPSGPVCEDLKNDKKLPKWYLDLIAKNKSYQMQAFEVTGGRKFYLLTYNAGNGTDIDLNTLVVMSARTLKKALGRTEIYNNNKEYPFQKLIREVQEEHLNDSFTIQQRLTYITGEDLDGNYYRCIITRPDQPETSDLKVIVNAVKKALPGSFVTDYNDAVVSLEFFKKRPNNDMIGLDVLENTANKFGFRACFNYFFSDLSCLRANHLLAEDALKLDRCLKISSNRVFRYEIYSMYNMMIMLKEKYAEKYGTDDMVYIMNPVALILSLYDRDHKSNLRKTLECYVSSNQSIDETAKQLYVHKNTVNYRLKKIKNLTNVDFENDDLRFALRFTCKLMEFLEKYYSVNLTENVKDST